MTGGPVRRRAVAAAALLLLSGCASGASSSSAEDLGLSAVAVYGRHAAVRGKVDVRLDNDGTRPLRVESVQVRHPLFARLPPTQRRSRIPADGDPRIVPVPFGDPLCAAADAAGAVVVLGVRTEQGLRDVEVPLRDGEPGLLRAHRLACQAAAVQEAAAVELGPEWERVPAGLRTTLRLTRRGAGEVEVREVGGNVLFSVRRPAALPRLREDARTASADVVVAATRCDPHALTESKRSFTFPVRVALDGGEPVLLQVTADATGQRALQALLAATCPALGGG